MWGAALLITQHCVSGRLGPIEVDAEPEAPSLMLKTGGTIIVQPYSQGTVSQDRWDQRAFSGERNQLCFAGGLEK